MKINIFFSFFFNSSKLIRCTKTADQRVRFKKFSTSYLLLHATSNFVPHKEEIGFRNLLGSMGNARHSSNLKRGLIMPSKNKYEKVKIIDVYYVCGLQRCISN